MRSGEIGPLVCPVGASRRKTFFQSQLHMPVGVQTSDSGFLCCRLHSEVAALRSGLAHRASRQPRCRGFAPWPLRSSCSGCGVHAFSPDTAALFSLSGPFSFLGPERRPHRAGETASALCRPWPPTDLHRRRRGPRRSIASSFSNSAKVLSSSSMRHVGRFTGRLDACDSSTHPSRELPSCRRGRSPRWGSSGAELGSRTPGPTCSFV